MESQFPGDEPLGDRVHRQGETLEGVGAEQGRGSVLAEGHLGRGAPAVDGCPSLGDVGIDETSVGELQRAPVEGLDAEFA